MRNAKRKKVYLFFKRIFDIIASLLAILVLSIPMLVVAIIIKIDSRGPILFKQKRIGKNKKIFKILKFRSMYINTDPNMPTHQLENVEKSITRVGSFIRKVSIDELPQIFNIFAGQMSVIGPRPALYNQDDLVAEREKYGVNFLRPGLTGLAQISGRDELEIPVKAQLDGEYLKRMSLWLDIKIFFKTIAIVFKGKGVREGKNKTTATNADSFVAIDCHDAPSQDEQAKDSVA